MISEVAGAIQAIHDRGDAIMCGSDAVTQNVVLLDIVVKGCK